MSGNADRMDYRDQPRGYQGWADRPGSNGRDHWSPFGGGSLAILATVLGFIVWWPLGLMLLFSQMWNGRMGLSRAPAFANGFRGWTPPWAGMCGHRQSHEAKPASSGNRAFDEYRSETLRRLEDEQREFGDFLDRLRVAKDKAEFDHFMADRRERASNPAGNPPGNPPGSPLGASHN